MPTTAPCCAAAAPSASRT
uniref:Uncharacterized protein n=1 Tax=Arundo donax TaxID=35708 RepID=A0A0A9E6R2_ARUDO